MSRNGPAGILRTLAGGSALPALALVALTLVVYIPALSAGFIWDDDDYVTGNPWLRDGHGLGQIWLHPGATHQYYPLVFSTFWIEFQLWGLHPLGYHLVNILLHAAAALLAWRVFRRLGLPGAWLAAAIFAVHPVLVESVAWITERKNVLSGVFYLAAALAYLDFSRPDGESPEWRRWGRYALASALFAAALLSKTVTATLPAALLLVLWWRRGRLPWRDAAALLPWMAAAAALAARTAGLEREVVGASGPAWTFTLAERILIAGRALWFYLGKLVWPAELTFIYPRWQIDASDWRPWVYPALAVLVVAALWLARRRIGRGPATAALFFAGTLAPALGFVSFYPMLFSFVADHFQYLAALGPIAAFAYLITRRAPGPPDPELTPCAPGPPDPERDLAPAVLVPGSSNPEHPLNESECSPSNRRGLPWKIILSAAVLLTLGVLTWRQAGIYRDLETLYTDTLAKNPGCWMAWGNLGAHYLNLGRYEEALPCLEAANALYQDSPGQWHCAGRVYEELGRYEEAEAAFRRAVALAPGHARAWDRLGVLLMKRRDFAGAGEAFDRVLAVQPDLAEAWFNRAICAFRTGDYATAWRALDGCRASGGQPDPRFLRDLERESRREDGGPPAKK